MEGQNMTTQQQNSHKGVFMLFIVLIVIFLGTGIFLLAQKTKRDKDTKQAVSSMNKPIEPSITPTPTLIPYAKKGSMYLFAPESTVKEGQSITLQVQATSDKSDIVGFDMVVAYDDSILEFRSADSAVSSFKSYVYPRSGYVSVTMIKSLQETQATVFDKTDIATVTFTAKKKGKTIVDLTAKGNDSTKFADNNANVTYPDTNQIDLEIN